MDEFVREYKLRRVDLVKVDTETTEPRVLRGMRDTLRRDRPHLICEVLVGYETGPAIEREVAPLGYTYYLLTSDGPRPRSHIVGDDVFRNYLLTPAQPPQLAGLLVGCKSNNAF